MWYLVSLTDLDQKIVLLAGHSYVVGRRDCDILITGDQAVSRKHAVLKVSHTEANLGDPRKQAIISLQDTSKFGTYVNGDKLSQERKLKDGDEVTFGSMSKFLVSCEMLVVTASCLDAASKRQLRKQLLILGGHLVGEWNEDCSLLVMSAISVTIKVIAAMITQKQIVTPKYFEDLVKFHQAAGPRPNPEDYEPPINEPQLNSDSVSFQPDPARATLFKGMVFFFLSAKQFKKLSSCLTVAGALPMLFDERNEDYTEDMLVAPGTVVMQCPPEELAVSSTTFQQHHQRVQARLKKEKKFFVQDADVGFAVLFCSKEKHCNPDFDSAEQLLQLLPSQTLSQSAAEVLVNDTESSCVQKKSKKVKWVDSSSAVADRLLGIKEVIKEQPCTPKTETFSQSPRAVSPAAPSTAQRGKSETSVLGEGPGESRAVPGRQQSDLKAEAGVPFSKTPRTAVEGLESIKIEPPDDEEPEIQSVKPSESKRSRREMINLDSDEDDLFPQPKKPRRRPHEEDDDDDLFPRRKNAASKPVEDESSGDDDDLFPKSSKATGRRVAETEPGVTERVEVVASKSKGQTQQQPEERKKKQDNSILERREGRQAGQSQVREDGGELEGPSQATGHGDGEPRVPSDVTPGFLSSRKAIKHQVQKCPRFEPETSVPEETVVVSFIDMVVRTDALEPARRNGADVQQRDVPEGFVVYNGKPVRNYKKFSKALHAGANRLPEIIGGRDLEVHTGNQKKELEEWFQQAREDESQRQQEEREANELFNFQQTGSRKRH